MIRCGENSTDLEEFKKGIVAIGWQEIGDLSNFTIIDHFKEVVANTYPTKKQSVIGIEAYILYRFAVDIKEGDAVVTYDSLNRQYHVGTVKSKYIFKKDNVRLRNIRKVQWESIINRDDLSLKSRNTLGSALTLFSINKEVWEEFFHLITNNNKPITSDSFKEDLENEKEDIRNKAHELLKDKIISLDEREMEELAAVILQAMGYRARVTPVGPDRGVDVIASPDGLGLQEPRIKVEVKHRPNTPMGSNEIRSFLGGLRQGDKGLYISTGGFTKDAKYEADRANVPLTLIDIDFLAQLVEQNYDRFDGDGKAMIPMVSILWPSD